MKSRSLKTTVATVQAAIAVLAIGCGTSIELSNAHNRDASTRDSSTRDASTRAAAPSVAEATLATGIAHSCALFKSGVVKCWGNNDVGQLGLGDARHRGDALNDMGDALPPVNLSRAAKAIAAGGNHTCALLDDNTVKCWGDNFGGQLGLGDTLNRGRQPSAMRCPW